MTTETPPLALPAAMLDEVRAAYATPPRAYHHFGHVEAVLAHYAEVADACGWARPREVYLAVLYHDAIYDFGATDNEARSAAFGGAAIERHLDPGSIAIDEVERLVNLTAAHGRIEPAGLEADTAHFLDCDMAILGAAAADVFDGYERAIAVEYAAVPIAAYRAGRTAFLERLLAREHIFLSAYFRARLEPRARANLQRALAELR